MRNRVVLTLTAATLLLASCTGHKAKPATSEGPYLRGSGTLRVLASSELTDLQPILDQAQAATGVNVQLTVTGTLDGVQTVTDGSAAQRYDATWFSSDRYLRLHPEAAARIGTETKIATSPVVFGLRASVAKRLGWDSHRPTWSEIAAAAGQRQFTYAMTNPAASNSGFSALVGVAAALSGTGKALTADEIAPLTPRLRAFFAGQSLAAGSSGSLADAYLRAAAENHPIDGIVNYESVILSLGAGGKLPEPLTVVYPADGVVTADYPLTLLSGVSEQTRTNYNAVVDYLRRPSVQRTIATRTFRRPATAGVPLASMFGPTAGGLFELPFPARLDAANALISSFGDSLRRPARTIYLLDVSGSMKGPRLAALQAALLGLTGTDRSLAGQFARFNGREQVIFLPFSTTPGPPARFDLPEQDLQPTFDQIRAATQALTAGGDTALYDALDQAYDLAAQLIATDPDRLTSIVLLTDGERTVGADLAGFTHHYQQLPVPVRAVPTFTILFGEGNADEMNQVATVTGGKSFDARAASLAAAFTEIRGYQ
jgi:Ca-activated chloride channel family protein